MVDLGTVSGVHDRLPDIRPSHRPELERRYLLLGPASMDIGFAGRKVADDHVHRAIARLRTGDAVHLDGRLVRSSRGQVVGRLAATVDPKVLQGGSIIVFAVMVRTWAQTPEEFRSAVKVDAWEVPLLEAVVARDLPSASSVVR